MNHEGGVITTVSGKLQPFW